MTSRAEKIPHERPWGPYELLWGEVIKEALAEAKGWYPPRRESAVGWFLSPKTHGPKFTPEGDYTPPTFLWLAAHLDIHAETFLRNNKARLVFPTKADWARHRYLDRFRKKTVRGLTAENLDRILTGEQGGDNG